MIASAILENIIPLNQRKPIWTTNVLRVRVETEMPKRVRQAVTIMRKKFSHYGEVWQFVAILLIKATFCHLQKYLFPMPVCRKNNVYKRNANCLCLFVFRCEAILVVNF